MNDDRYLPPFPNARWAISRAIAGKRICLVQNTGMHQEEDIGFIFHALEIPHTQTNQDLYFPHIEGRGRCPTLDLLELFSTIDRLARDKQKEIGV